MQNNRLDKRNCEQESLTRIAIVNNDRCKPKKCNQECRRSCPVNRTGKLCIEVKPESTNSNISEELCIGCGICVRQCPFDAISIINLPSNLDKDTTHRYGLNSFKLHRLPIPRQGQVLGLVGSNGTGKTTALKVLAGNVKPNLGRYSTPPDWQEIIKYFRGSELQSYFTKILEENLKTVFKRQDVDRIPQLVQGLVHNVLQRTDELSDQSEIYELFDLSNVQDRQISDLSGGELQRFTCAMACMQKGDIYIFDEPSSYLDIKQRLKAAVAIRNLIQENRYIIAVEHDLSVLDYLSDFICILYGSASHYGVVTMPFSVREGINIFLDGFIRTENLRFRDVELTFKVVETASKEEVRRLSTHYYPAMKKNLDSFDLSVDAGSFTESEIIVLLGENGTGKTTLIQMLAGKLEPDNGVKMPQMNVSYKPQKISPKFTGTVRNLLHAKIGETMFLPQFQTDVSRPLQIDKIIDNQVQDLSGGELQRVALCLCLGKSADVYLIDEPSAFLDSEQRLHAARAIKRFLRHYKKVGFVVEHDFLMATYLADRVIVFDGEPSIKTHASEPQALLPGMNSFLKQLEITFRRDPRNGRPRINKKGSFRDKEQKSAGQYFFLE
ncbi:unnamed protein product [Rotaria sp. Silwood1]|nr:unnamed protein product [Rotaria sp. Silwood1]CAF1571779.1 unnamed protein product [Rotaria sp. Silwood1]